MKKKRIVMIVASLCCSLLSFAQMSGSGTEEAPYQIRTADDLFDVRINLSAHYKLMNDIDLTEWIAEENPSQGWNPITNFQGVFDGNGKQIKGLYINRSSGAIGLFGSTTNATIRNLTLDCPTIITEQSGVGALIGTGSANIADITIISPKINSHGSTGAIAGQLSGGSVSGNIKVLYAEINCTGYDVGGAFGKVNTSVNNLVLTAPNIVGLSRVGGAVGSCAKVDIKNVTIISPSISGGEQTGGLVGNWTTTYDTAKRYLDNNCILGGTIIGGKYTGGLVGYADKYYMTSGYERHSYITSNYCSSSITVRGTAGYAGGICGYISGTYWSPKYSSITTYQYQTPIVHYNRFDGDIIGQNVVGGLIGYAYTRPDDTQNHNVSHSGSYQQNIITGSIEGKTIRGVFGYGTITGGSFSNNIVCLDRMTATASIQRIGKSGSNYASLSLMMFLNGEEYTVEDGGENGTGYSLRMLKRKNTYIGFGFDFDANWSIVDGESLPYNIKQSQPPTILECYSGLNARVVGTAEGNGIVYVLADGRVFEGEVQNGSWEVPLDNNIADGTLVRVSVETNGMRPSVLVSSTAVLMNRIVLDETSITMPTAYNNANVTVRRTIKGGEWGTICLPFAMTEAQVKAAFGENVLLGDFNDYEVSADGTSISVKFNAVTAMAANHPYVIKTEADVSEFTVDGVDIDPVDEPTINFGTKRKPRAFIGCYKAGTEIGNGCLFISAGKFWYSVGGTRIKAFRGYFDFDDLLPSFEANYAEARIYMVFSDEQTGIAVVEDAADGQFPVYDLQGRQVAEPANGIYVRNGKKFVVK